MDNPIKDRKIAIIKGDGIGVDVVNEAVKVLHTISAKHQVHFQLTNYPWGSNYYFEHGMMAPEDFLDVLEQYDAILLGAVGHPKIQDNITLDGLLLPIRRKFDQFVCLRPSVLYPGVTSPLMGKSPYDIDLIVIRENTEGEYSQIGGFAYNNTPDEIAVQTAIFTRKGCERVIRYAFDLARTRNKKKHVTSITKSNALKYMTLWDRTFVEVAEEYSDISTDSLLIDAACMDFIRNPEKFDVVVASNLFGDILTDIGAMITGSLGLASSGNINPNKNVPSMFEPTHGSAPDIAGKGIANPMAQILTTSMMLHHLGLDIASQQIDDAVLQVLDESETLTPDLGGTSSTESVGEAIRYLIKNNGSI